MTEICHPNAPRVVIATANFENGGYNESSGYHLEPFADHIAETVPDVDMLFFQEGHGYDRDGGAQQYRMQELLADRLGADIGSDLAPSRYGPHANLTFYRRDIFRKTRDWLDYRTPDTFDHLAGQAWYHVAGMPEEIRTQSLHWRFCDPATRLTEARRLGNSAEHIAVIGGDFNDIEPDEGTHIPWHLLTPPRAFHKTRWDESDTRRVSDTTASAALRDQGWVDAGALAGDPTPTTCRSAAPCRIDRITVSPPCAAAVCTDTYTVHQPDPKVSDHCVVSVALDLRLVGAPFHWEPWDRLGWTYAGADGGWRRITT